MSLRKKFILKLTLTFLGFAIFIAVISIISFRNYGLKTAENTSRIVAELVRDGLTVHMVTGTMDQREYFLDQVEHIKEIKKLWIVRGESVNRQFGDGTQHEKPRDELDLKALETGEIQKKVIEDLDKSIFRITIPYIATSKGKINCLSCHNVNEGDVLGAISIELDVTESKLIGIRTVLMLLAASGVVLVLSGLYMSLFVGKYVDLFEKLKKAMKRAIHGDFSSRIETDLKDEAGDTVREFNHFMGQLHQNFNEIKKVMDGLASADLSVRITKEMEGEFKALKDNINKSIDALSKTLSITINGFNQIINKLKILTEEIKSVSENMEIQNVNLKSINESIDNISESIKKISGNTEYAQEVSRQVQSDIATGEEDLAEMERAMENLNEAGKNIHSVTKNIISIADQTNLLALNAAIEAARAGETGKGFAVVADEVRKLAEDTSKLAKDIQSMVQEILNTIHTTSEVLIKTHTGYKEMSKNYNEMAKLMDEIANAIQKQTEAIIEMRKNIENITEISEENTIKNKDAAQHMTQLSEIADNVKHEVEKFKVE
ncbi:methyl-accepting chemotaxis protein [Persephonella sp.]